MRSQIFVLLMLFTPGILGISTPMETNDADDESTELLITDDLLQVNESSVESTDISNGVSIGCAHACMHVQFIYACKLRTLQCIIIIIKQHAIITPFC